MKRKEFSYSGNVESGVTLHFEIPVSIPANLFQKILANFQGQTIPGGFCMTSPTRGGLGDWIQNNFGLSPKYGSHIAAILVHEGFIKSSLQRNAIYLHF
jgi:hypothetical protein